jgi:hypothetical protein
MAQALTPVDGVVNSGAAASKAGLADPAKAPYSDAKARQARIEDYHEIVALQLRNGLSTRSYADWSALWTDNPGQLNQQLPIGWVLEGAGGEVRGYFGNLPLAYQFRGRTLQAVTAHSWVVDPAYRCHSLKLAYRFLKQDVDLFVVTTPNAITEKALRAFKFSRVNSGRWDQTGFWITGYRGFARSALRAASMPWPGMLAYPLSAALFLGDAFAGPRPRSPGGEFELCSGFDFRFDDFWEELKGEQEGCLLAERSRATLEWHFRPALARNDAWILAVQRGSRLVAYAIFDRQDRAALQLTRLRLTDFQALHGFEGLLRPALGWMLNKCRDEGIHVAENVGCWLERFGVAGTAARHHRRLHSWLFYYKTRDQELFRQLADPNVWVPSSFDGDASL